MSQLERVYFIDKRIRETGRVTAAEVAQRFENSERQVKRDIEYLRDRLGAPIVWQAKGRAYAYKKPWEGLRFADEHSLFALAFLKAILKDYHYVPVISERLTQEFSQLASGSYASIVDSVSYELPDMESIEEETSYALCQALLRKKALGIHYTDSKGKESARQIDPCRLINYSGKWYALARDRAKDALRVFALSRMRDAELLETKAGPAPSKKEIDELLSSSYGIFKGRPIGTAVLRFSGGAARAVKDQTWHPKQRSRQGKDEGGHAYLELSLPVHDWTEILGRALRCGSACEVIGPPEFRARWVREIGKLSALAGHSVSR